MIFSWKIWSEDSWKYARYAAILLKIKLIDYGLF